jgi:hypothetical protein
MFSILCWIKFELLYKILLSPAGEPQPTSGAHIFSSVTSNQINCSQTLRLQRPPKILCPHFPGGNNWILGLEPLPVLPIVLQKELDWKIIIYFFSTLSVDLYFLRKCGHIILSIYNFAWRLLKATKKVYLIPQKWEKNKDAYGIHPTKFADSTRNTLKMIKNQINQSK